MSGGADAEIHNIADTAIWIAGYRAEESARPDAVFHDPYAAMLAGERGLAMARNFEAARIMSFAMVVRTVAIDRLVLKAIERGADTVVNLGAGLDTRPYRLQLPPNLNWIEVDFPETIRYKESKLSDTTPKCNLTRRSTDLLNRSERHALFDDIARMTSNACIITEGVVGYLTSEQARELSLALHATSFARHWIMDYSRSKFRKSYSKKLAKVLKSTPLRFNVKEPLLFFENDGWRVEEDLHLLDVADSIGRTMPFALPWGLLFYIIPKTARRLGNSTRGYVMFGK